MTGTRPAARGSREDAAVRSDTEFRHDAGSPVGIGVDVVALSRMRDVLETSGASFKRRVCTPLEREIVARHPDPAVRLALTFAAKEAVFKTLGIGWESGVELAEVEVREGPHGEPEVALSGRFAAAAAERGVSRVLLSLSSDGDVAIAVAVAVAVAVQ